MNFFVEANSRFADRQFDGTGWSKTIYVRNSCWSSQVNQKVPVTISFVFCKDICLWSSFELVGDRRLFTCSESVCRCGM